MGDGEKTPTPSGRMQIEWGPAQFKQLHDKLVEVEAKADWTYTELAQTKSDLMLAKEKLRATEAELASLKVEPGKGEAKGADPPIFQGDQKELESWITACRLRFASQPSKFGTEWKKVVFATSFLRGPPLLWFQPVIQMYTAADPDAEIPAEFQSFATFVESIRTLYGDPDIQRNSERAIHHIKQDRTVAEYISRFATHAQHTKFDDSALASHFYEGLDDGIKDELATREWTNLRELQNLASRLDNRARQREIEKKRDGKTQGRGNPWAATPPRRTDGTFLPTKSPFSTPPTRTSATPNPFGPLSATPVGTGTPASDGSTPMELDALRLTAEEKARCWAENRCFGCKKVGHSAKVCRSRREWKVAAIEVEVAPPENDDVGE